MENTNEASRSLASAIDIGFLDPKKAEFYVTAGGFTGLRYEGNDYKRITLRRAFPIGKPSEYMSFPFPCGPRQGSVRDCSSGAGKALLQSYGVRG